MKIINLWMRRFAGKGHGALRFSPPRDGVAAGDWHARVLQRAGEIFGFKPHEQGEVAKAQYLDFARWVAALPIAQRPQEDAAAFDVLAERRRQVTHEDWTPAHDDGHPCGEIAAFAALYALPPPVRDWPASETGYGDTIGAALCPVDWQPKFGDRRRELVKAGALILAEIERLDRAAEKDRDDPAQTN